VKAEHILGHRNGPADEISWGNLASFFAQVPGAASRPTYASTPGVGQTSVQHPPGLDVTGLGVAAGKLLEAGLAERPTTWGPRGNWSSATGRGEISSHERRYMYCCFVRNQATLR